MNSDMDRIRARRARSAKGHALLLLVTASLGPLACFPPHPRPYSAGFTILWNEYLELPPHRAVAIAGDPYDRWLAGMSGCHATKPKAEASAMEACLRERAANRQQIPCRIYATDDEIRARHR